jgi:hypothetical protein
VLYDTGDFIEDYSVLSPRNDQSFIFMLDVNPETKTAEKITLIPTCISNCQVNLAQVPMAGQICDRMAMLCNEMGTKTRRDGNNLVIEF